MPERKIVVITGASAGVGRATATKFASNGFDVALLARGTAGLEGAAVEVERAGGRALICPVDVSRYEEVDDVASRVEAELGAIDVWVNNAMTTIFAPIWEVGAEDFKRAVDVTFFGQVWGTKAALARMQPRDRGSIVNVGSALAHIAIPLQSAYCSSKFASRGFFESVRAELLHERSHVRISMVHLPAVNTPQFSWCKTSFSKQPRPVPPIYEPEIPAKFIFDVAMSGQRSRVVGSWNRMLVALGSVFPSFANQYAAIGAWESQFSSESLPLDRAINLQDPADEDEDVGTHGIFDSMARGFADPSFLRTLPQAASTFARALARTLEEKRRSSASKSQ